MLIINVKLPEQIMRSIDAVIHNGKAGEGIT